ADGTPRSPAYDDIYHPRSGALAQARHVFLADGALAGRWRGRDRFVVLETGFGLGNNFLATWAAWRDDPARCRQLHFVSIEASPPTRAALAAVARDPLLAPLAAELVRRWPPLTCNLHRIAFDGDAVELLLAFGSVSAWLPQLVAAVDAFFLDGFAPARNPAMWEPRVFKAMARLAAPDATVATWSAARAVRDGLASAGFAVERAAGSDGKRDITRARFAPRVPPRSIARRAETRPIAIAASTTSAAADAVVVGAGLAGSAVAAALARRGVRALVLERGAEVAAEASGNAVAIFHGIVHGDDGRHARFHRAAALTAADEVRFAIARHGLRGSADGLLRLEARLDVAAMQAIVDAQKLPPEYVVALDADAASGIAGVRVAVPAWHYPRGGWVDPRALARAWLHGASGRAELRLRTAVGSLRRVAGRWLVAGEDGATIAEAAAVVVCDGSGTALFGERAWPVRRQRGQTTAIASRTLAALPRVPIAGNGHVVPPLDGLVWTGTSTAWNDDDVELRPAEQRRNLERLARLLDLAGVPELDALAGRVAFRWTSADRLPIAGAVPAAIAAASIAGCEDLGGGRPDRARLVERAPGLFVCAALGSRGVAAASLAAGIVAAQVAGAPLPAEADLVEAVDPARFAVRRFRRGAAARAADDADQPPVGPIAGSLGG
nr:FAD-dependent 5-carboxymethylaminomethyl-2-thiouridine(34) oxidoreductase MnmC [Caldimonas sp.]